MRTAHGLASECVFTWDTAMRLRRRLQALGAEVVLTLQDPAGDYAPQLWTPTDFPDHTEFRYKTLVENPTPRSIHDALLSRVSTANRVYREASGPTYFFSLHFDSTAPEVGGVKFYYPRWKGAGSGFIRRLEESIRQAGRARVDLRSGEEIGLSERADYSVLQRSVNPDSYLIELGNVMSCDPQGGNPDLWRMRQPKRREEYAAMIAKALVRRQEEVAGPPAPPARRPKAMSTTPSPAEQPDSPHPGLVVAALLLPLLALAFRRRRVDEQPRG
jgi:N-acetylmuramoyl-L-alanine amidase